jgi:hypothetical protein
MAYTLSYQMYKCEHGLSGAERSVGEGQPCCTC